MHSAWTSTNLKRARSSQNAAPDSNFSKEKMRESQQAAGEIIAAVASYVVMNQEGEDGICTFICKHISANTNTSIWEYCMDSGLSVEVNAIVII